MLEVPGECTEVTSHLPKRALWKAAGEADVSDMRFV
jgi:hypothetical protein